MDSLSNLSKLKRKRIIQKASTAIGCNTVYIALLFSTNVTKPSPLLKESLNKKPKKHTDETHKKNNKKKYATIENTT